MTDATKVCLIDGENKIYGEIPSNIASEEGLVSHNYSIYQYKCVDIKNGISTVYYEKVKLPYIITEF